MSIRLSVCPYPFSITFLPSDFQNYFFVWKVWHQIPIFNNFCSSSVRLSVRPFRIPHSISVPYPSFNFRSNSQIFKILFLFERYDIRDLSLYFLSVCPYPLSPSVLAGPALRPAKPDICPGRQIWERHFGS